MIEPQAVLDYWFGAATNDPVEAKRRSQLWYGSTAEQDATMAAQFGAALTLAEQQALPDWQATTAGQLALVILLDQLSRNLYRGTARAFANDPQALEIASNVVDSGDHLSLTPVERAFLYHPFEHSEDRQAQQRSIALFTELAATAAPEWQEQMASFLRFAQAHRDIVDTYGRYPHRNAVLNRQSTTAELAFLEKGPRFGQ